MQQAPDPFPSRVFRWMFALCSDMHVGMKLDANLLDEELLIGRVVASVRAVSGLPLSRITLEARLREDLGVRGRDGYALMASLHDQFQMDWTGFDLAEHFGDGEVATHSLTIAQLAEALRRGCWPADRSAAPCSPIMAVIAVMILVTVGPIVAGAFRG
jgi:hypothetical protein